MKKNILLVSHSMSRTGAPIVILNIANNLDKNQYEVMIYNINSLNNQLYNEVDKSIKIEEFSPFLLRLKNSKFIIVKMMARVLEKFIKLPDHFDMILQKYNPDIVLINTIYHLSLSDITAKRHIKTIRYIHELESYQYSLSEDDKVRLLTSKDKLWACSQKVADVLSRYYNKTNIEIVYPLVQIEDTNNHKKLNTNNNYKIISAGVVDFRKGFDLWIDVAINVVKKNKNVIFEWYGKLEGGDKEYFEYCMDRIPIKLKNNILYKGETKDLQRVLSEANLFFLSSREEPFSIVVIESLGYGLTSVGFKSGGIIESLEKKGVAKTVELGQTEKLSNIILEFSKDKITIEKAKCLEAYQEFDFDKNFLQIEVLINDGEQWK